MDDMIFRDEDDNVMYVPADADVPEEDIPALRAYRVELMLRLASACDEPEDL
jgi:hypothetical protein